jgi:hypothetical protein
MFSLVLFIQSPSFASLFLSEGRSSVLSFRIDLDSLFDIGISRNNELIIVYFSFYRKHALTLQLHTAHILSAHASLQEKSKAIQDIKEQKNKYGSLFEK